MLLPSVVVALDLFEDLLRGVGVQAVEQFRDRLHAP